MLQQQEASSSGCADCHLLLSPTCSSSSFCLLLLCSTRNISSFSQKHNHLKPISFLRDCQNPSSSSSRYISNCAYHKGLQVIKEEQESRSIGIHNPHHPFAAMILLAMAQGKSFKESLKALEADIQHANTLASEFPRDYDGACLQMRLSYGPAAHFFLFLVRWTDCSLAGALGLLRILIYKVLIVQNAAMMYKSHPHVMSCWPLHHLLLLLHISKERLLSSQCLHLDFLQFCVLLQSFHLFWVLLL